MEHSRAWLCAMRLKYCGECSGYLCGRLEYCACNRACVKKICDFMRVNEDRIKKPYKRVKRPAY